MKPKENKPKKLDAKELEALRLAEEAKKKEEEERVRLEELKKYEVKRLSTGLELVLTEYCVSEMWKHENPKEFIIEFMEKYFTRENMIQRFTKTDLLILAEFHVFNLIFAHEQLHLDPTKSTILLNVFWEMLKNKNAKYRPSEKNAVKTREDDYDYLTGVLVKHCIENPPENLKFFQPEQLKLVLEYAKQGYLNHFNLYQYVAANEQREEETQTMVYIDSPIETLPLSEARFLGTDKSVIKDEEEEIHRQIQEKLQRQEEEERKRKEQEEAIKREIERERELKEQELDPATMEIIRAKVKEAEESIQKSLVDRQKELDEKFENIAKTKKK